MLLKLILCNIETNKKNITHLQIKYKQKIQTNA